MTSDLFMRRLTLDAKWRMERNMGENGRVVVVPMAGLEIHAMG